MEWTKKRIAFAAAVVALPIIIVFVVMVVVLQGPSTGSSSPGGTNFAPPRSSLVPKATNSLPLAGFYDMPSASFAGDNTFAWPGIPRDLQTFSNVRINIDGATILGGGTGAQQNYHYREKVTGIPMNRKFESLYLYHFTMWSDSPGAPVYDLVMNYEDGSSSTNVIKYATDIFDFYAPPNDATEPSGTNSVVAWRGYFTVASGANQALRTFLTELKNPKPSVLVISLDIYSRKNKSAGCVLGITTGPPGLIHNAKAVKTAVH